jgi:cob(I)alamin adenosyltransferase
MEEKEILAEAIINYEELRRILRKTEYEIYLGELKSKLNNLYFKRTLSEALGSISLARVSLIGRGSSINRKISELQEELRNAKNTVKVSEEIQDRVFSLFKNYISENKEFDLRKEVDETNTLITRNILQTLESSIKYQLEKIENRISKGRLYLAQMKDSQRKYDKVIEKFEDTENENNIETKKKYLEEIYDETLGTVYEADLAIKDSKWLRVVVYLGLLLTILALI